MTTATATVQLFRVRFEWPNGDVWIRDVRAATPRKARQLAFDVLMRKLGPAYAHAAITSSVTKKKGEN
jgi:hypothetical protein